MCGAPTTPTPTASGRFLRALPNTEDHPARAQPSTGLTSGQWLVVAASR